MKKIGGNEIFGLLREYRFLWIEGRVGGGKTSFAVELAEFYAEKGYRVVANIPVAFAEDAREVNLMDDGMAHVFMILDEGGMWLPSDAAAKRFRAFLAKLDIMVVLSSTEEPPRSFRRVRLEPEINFLKVGLPMVFYRWALSRGRKEDSGKFLWMNPKSPWGKYSRQYPAISANGLDTLMDRLVSQFVAHHGDEEVVPNDASERNWFAVTEQDAAAALIDAAEIMAEAADRMGAAEEPRKRKKRRFKIF